MKKEILQYLNARAAQMADELRLGNLEVIVGKDPTPTSTVVTTETTSALAIQFAGTDRGTLLATHPSTSPLNDKQRTVLEAFAAQAGALWDLPDGKIARQLDEAMQNLKIEHPRFHWAGIYRLMDNTLYLTAFRGEPTPHPIIPHDRGICGAAVKENRTLNIEDVRADERYLSCDSRTRSELVVPVRDPKGNPIGEIDIDSHLPGAFTPREVKAVEALAEEIAPLLIGLAQS